MRESREPESAADGRPSTGRVAVDREEYLRSLLNQALDAMFTTRGGRIIDCNRRAVEMFGYSEDDLRGRAVSSLSPVLQLDGVRSEEREAELVAVAGRGVPQVYEWQFRRSDGTVLDADVAVNRVDVGGETYCHFVVRDATERKAAEDERRYRTRLEHVVLHASTHLLACASEEINGEITAALARAGHVTEADRAYVFTLRDGGRSMDNTHEWAAEGIAPQMDHLQDLRCEVFPWWMARLEAGETINIERVSEMPATASAEREILEQQDIRSLLVVPMLRRGRLVGFLGLDLVRSQRKWEELDITLLETLANVFVSALERIRGRRRVDERDERLELALLGADLAMWDVDLERGAMYFSPRWAELLGYSEDQVPTDLSAWKGIIHPEDFEETAEAMFAHLGGERPFFAGDFRVRTADGDWKWFRVRGRVVKRADDGSPIRAAGTLLDIDERTRTAIDRERLTEQLHHSQKVELIGRLTGSVAHDFNNLLVPILTNAEFLLDELEPGSEAVEDALSIAEAARRAAALSKQLLATSRKQMMHIEEVRLADIVTSSERLLQRLLRENISWESCVDHAGPTIAADRGLLEQVLMNLVVNAADAMPDGGTLTIETDACEIGRQDASLIPDGRHGAFARLTVTDTGHGMEPHVLEQIFEPFYTTKKAGQGTGLGLATVYGIVNQHGGFVSVDSAPGQGTTFRVHLPVGEKPPVRVRSSAPATTVRGPLRVMLVEDDVHVRATISNVLKRGGHLVDEADSAETALEMLATRSERPDLLIADIVLPGADGKQLFDEVRDFYPGTRVLFTSGYPNESSDVIEAFGQQAFLAKPFTREELLRAVRDAASTPLDET